MRKLTRLEKYHLNKVSQRSPRREVAITPEAMEIESRQSNASAGGITVLLHACGFSAWMPPPVKSNARESRYAASSASPKATVIRTWTTAGSDAAEWCMTNPHDGITVGSVTLPYSINRRGWVAPSGDVIRNPLKAQRLAELMNKQKVAA
nr:MAG TPA: Protein of unknown function (DUF1317) [Caudoviricetes sp.]